MAASLTFPVAQLVYAYADRGEREAMLRAAERAGSLSPSAALRGALQSLVDSVVAGDRGPK